MTYISMWNFDRTGYRFLRSEPNSLNPLPGLSFVTISYWQNIETGEIVGVID